MRLSKVRQLSLVAQSAIAALVVAAVMASRIVSASKPLRPRKFTNPRFSSSLSDLQLQRLASTAKEERAWLDIKEGSLLSPVLVPRQVGSAGYRRAQSHIVDTLTELGYAISWDNFTASTPTGAVRMGNIVATLNPRASKRLVLAAHYESKILEDGDFVGATDSAVPVAMLLDTAKGLSAQLDAYDGDTTLQLVFFDGEEAYADWTQTDSLYGSRHLADLWEHKADAATEAAMTSLAEQTKPELERIDLLVLLDLIGAPDNAFIPLQLPTAGVFSQLAELEARLHAKQLVTREYMNTKVRAGVHNVDDDQRPFVERNVPVLHLISVPFPEAWHTLQDNADALSQTTIDDMAVIMRSFVASYLKLSV